MFILNNKPLSPDVAFTHNGVQYPNNWLRLASPEERAAIGITEVPDPPRYDERFYWGVGNPKDLEQLKAQWKLSQKQTANSLLNPTDWMIIRGVENPGKPASLEVKAYRAAVRDTSSVREAKIEAATTVDELIATLDSLIPWPNNNIETK